MDIWHLNNYVKKVNYTCQYVFYFLILHDKIFIMREKPGVFIKNQIVIVLIASLYLFSSCNENSSNIDKVLLSQNGLALANKSVNSYQLLNDALKSQQFDNEMIRILTDHSPSTYSMQLNNSKSEIIDQNIKKQAAFILLRKAYSSYNLFLDHNFDYRSSSLQNTLYAACAVLDSFEIPGFYTERVQILKQQISGGHFKEQIVILELSKLYADLWDQDAQKWFVFLENDLKNYKEGINKIANNLFDASKVKMMVDKPYKDEAILVNLYKLQLVKEKEIQVEALMDEIQKVSTSFVLLIELNGELAKKNPDQGRINAFNNQLEAIVTN
ncbi:MAG: hypothetical protein DRI95_00295 [Bacteroidetes bacterium]|nr:MAG: hypothetical protein DRI95_00295 [Bacteroidota bacterium]